MAPRPAHRFRGGRSFRRVVATQQNDTTGTGTGSSVAGSGLFFLVREEDGTSRLTFEEGNGSMKREESN